VSRNKSTNRDSEEDRDIKYASEEYFAAEMHLRRMVDIRLCTARLICSLRLLDSGIISSTYPCSPTLIFSAAATPFQSSYILSQASCSNLSYSPNAIRRSAHVLRRYCSPITLCKASGNR